MLGMISVGAADAVAGLLAPAATSTPRLHRHGPLAGRARSSCTPRAPKFGCGPGPGCRAWALPFSESSTPQGNVGCCDPERRTH